MLAFIVRSFFRRVSCSRHLEFAASTSGYINEKFFFEMDAKDDTTANILNYRHSKYAGNHGDVLKHSALVQLLLSLEESPDRNVAFIDTHAGIGRYSLSKDAECQDGIMRLLEQKEIPVPALQDYMSLIRSYQKEERVDDHTVLDYPGSPWIAKAILEARFPNHKLYWFEVNPNQHELLRENFSMPKKGQDKNISIKDSDGYQGAIQLLEEISSSSSSSSGEHNNKQKLVVLIDPPYKEVAHECNQVKSTVKRLLQLDPKCTIMVWVPMISNPEETRTALHDLKESLHSVASEIPTNEETALHWFIASLQISRKSKGLLGSSVWMINPPMALSNGIIMSLSWLADCLQKDCCHYHLETD